MKHFENWLHHIVSVLPAVYDNTLSYYEILSKVISALKEEAEKLEALGEDVEELKTAISTIESTLNTLSATVENVENSVENINEKIPHFLYNDKEMHGVNADELTETFEAYLIIPANCENIPDEVKTRNNYCVLITVPFLGRTATTEYNLNFQFLIEAGEKTNTFTRVKSSTGWAVWHDNSVNETFGNFKEIFSGDLDELKTTGTYHINGNSSNIPVENVGGLCYVNDFTNTADGTTTTQLYVTATTTPELYFRTTSNTGIFAAWHKVNEIDISGKMDKPTSTYYNHFGAVGVNGGVDWSVDFTTLNVLRAELLHTTHMANCNFNGIQIIPANNNVVDYPDISVRANGGLMITANRNVGTTWVCSKLFVENVTGKIWILRNPALEVTTPHWILISDFSNFGSKFNDFSADMYNRCTGGKNLMKLLHTGGYTYVNNGITFTYKNDGTISATGTATGLAVCPTAESSVFGTLPNGNYTVTGTPVDGEGKWSTAINYDGRYYYDNGSGVNISVSDTKKLANVTLLVNAGNTVDITFKPMIRLTSISNDEFLPYIPTNLELYNMIKNLTPTT